MVSTIFRKALANVTAFTIFVRPFSVRPFRYARTIICQVHETVSNHQNDIHQKNDTLKQVNNEIHKANV